ncbi:MAG: cobalt ECF transporter T component CbiQ [Desulfofundulus sp.]|uniref:cobalt ECF transporter T component CbiQ n=1 Tax=Desulfofundulus sp. TaxID=2282750 RepID=UPI003C77B476
MFKIDQYAYTSSLRHVHPGEKFAFAVLTMGICLAASSILVPVLVTGLATAAVIWGARIPARFYFKLLLLPLGFLVTGLLAIVLTISRKPDPAVHGFVFWGITLGVTLPALYHAGLLFARAIGAVSCLYFLSLTTPMVEIISVLHRLKVPALLIELMGLVYRFIFVIMETASSMYISQASRCGYASPGASYRSLAHLVSNLFVRSFYRSQALFTALLARGYTGELMVLENSRPVSGKNIALIAVVDSMLLVLVLVSRRWPV